VPRWFEGRGRSVERSIVIRNARQAAAAGLAAALGATALSLAHHLGDQRIPAVLAQRIDAVDRIIVDKSERRLLLMNDEKILKGYRIALGANPVGHKEIQGDSRTPEGQYAIDRRLPYSDFHRALHISYPDAESRRFAAAIRRSPGGAIMIHGQPNDLGWIERMTRRTDWTDGCIAVSNRAIEELWHAVPDGTPITIRP
jgi:murein L,D-transpeptidase YafK